MLHRVIGVLHRVLGVLHQVLGVLHRVLGVLYRVLGVLHQVLGVLHRVLDSGEQTLEDLRKGLDFEGLAGLQSTCAETKAEGRNICEGHKEVQSLAGKLGRD